MIALRRIAFLSLSLLLATTFAGSNAHAQERETPYWATLRFGEVNMRVGPSAEYPIDWVYKRKGLPVRVVRLREGWRYVEDHEGTRGWIAASQLSPSLGALIVGDGLAELRDAPDASGAVRWRAEPGVVGDLLSCRESFCEVDIAGRSGWVQIERLWGAGEMAPAP